MAPDSLRLVMGLSCCRSSSGAGLRFMFFAAYPVSELFDDFETNRDEEDGQEGSRQHAADDYAAQHAARYGACTGGCPQGNASQEKCERRHQDGTQPEFCAG